MSRARTNRVSRAAIIASIVLGALLGCSTLPKYYPWPTFDQSHAILIDKTIAALPISSLVKDYVKKAERLIVVSIDGIRTEPPEPAFNPRDVRNFNYVIEDNLTAGLTAQGFRVFERDENMITRIIPEQGANYKRTLLRQLPTHPSIVLLDGLEKEGLLYLDPFNFRETFAAGSGENGENAGLVLMNIDRLSLPEISAFYKQLKEDYAALESQLIRMDAADVIVSYRLLESGIFVDIEKRYMKQLQPDGTGAGFFDPKLWTWNVKRNAMARIFVRVMDAKTGEIRIAKVLQSESTDTVTFKQDKDEPEGSFLARANAYITLLEKYHYEWFEQQMPNLYGGQPKVSGVTSTSTDLKKNIFNKAVGPSSGSARTSQGDYVYPNYVGLLVSGGPVYNLGGYESSSSIPASSLQPSLLYSRSLGGKVGLLAGVGAETNSTLHSAAVLSVGITSDASNAFRFGMRLGGRTDGKSLIVSTPLTFRFGALGLNLDFGIQYMPDVYYLKATSSSTSYYYYDGLGPVIGLGVGLAF